MNSPSIKSWPETERPRERILANGKESLSDAELIAILLRTGIRGMDAIRREPVIPADDVQQDRLAGIQPGFRLLMKRVRP